MTEKFDPEPFVAEAQVMYEAMTDFFTGEAFEKSGTPEGVPEEYHYVSPDMKPPEEAEVVQSPHGGLYTEADPSDHEEVEVDDPRTQEYGHEEYSGYSPEDISAVDTDFNVRPSFDEDLEQGFVDGLAYLQDKELLDAVDTAGGEPPIDRFGSPFACWDPNRSYLFINPDVDPDVIEQAQSEGKLAGDSYKDLVSHECMHSLHEEALGGSLEPILESDLDQDEEEWLIQNVSEYAAKAPQEAVAEIGSLLLKGEDVPPRALEIYHEYEGPEL